MQIHICRFLLLISKVHKQNKCSNFVAEMRRKDDFFIRKQSICIKRFPISTYNSSTQINRWDCSGTLDDQLIEEYIPLRPRHHSLVHHQQFVQLTWLLCSLLNLDLDLGGVWTIGRKTIGRQRTIGRGGQSVAEGQSVAVDNRSLKDDRSQTIGRRVKILNLHISLMANSEYKKIGNWNST